MPVVPKMERRRKRTGVVGDTEWTSSSDSHIHRAKLSVFSLKSYSMDAVHASEVLGANLAAGETVLCVNVAVYRLDYASLFS